VPVLAVTTLLLYYGGEETRLPARWIHIGVGLARVLLVPLHIVPGYRTRRLREHGTAADGGAAGLAAPQMPRSGDRQWSVRQLAEN